jgi:hypothetical protein
LLNNIKNPVKVAAWSGVIVVIVAFVYGVLSKLFLGNVYLMVGYFLTIAVLMSLFYYGFYRIGKRYKNKLLYVVSMIMIVFALLYMAIWIPISFNTFDIYGSVGELEKFGERIEGLEEKYGGEDNVPDEEVLDAFNDIKDELISFLIVILVFHFLFSVLYGVLLILFGVGLKRLGKKVEFAKPTGILSIVGGATLILFVGYVILAVAFVFMLVLLFKESKKIRKVK